MAAAEGWKRSGFIRGPGIPAPSGQYRVGYTNLMHKFEDETNTLLVRLFYPCQEGGRYQYAKWNPHKRYAKGYLEYTKSSAPGALSTIVGVITDPRIPALNGAPLFTGKQQTVTNPEGVNTTTEGSEGVTPEAGETTPTTDAPVFPVMVYSHGLGAMSTTYSAICCDVASQGYLVASVEHRERSACVAHLRVPKPRGREGELVDEWLEHRFIEEGEAEFPVRNEQVKKRAVDARRALDLLGLLNEGAPVGNLLEMNFDFGQFKGRLDLEKAAMMGHSFGGATTIQTLSEDQRFKCGVCLDTWMLPVHKELYENGSVVQQPLIFINSYDFQWKENIQQMTQMTTPPNEQGISTSRIVTLIGTNHYYQTDILFVFPLWLTKTPQSALDSVTAHRVNMDISYAFLKRHLLLDPAFQGPIPNLDGCEGHSEHILFGSNVDITEPQETEQPAPVEAATNDEQEVHEATKDEPNEEESGQEAAIKPDDTTEEAAAKETDQEQEDVQEAANKETVTEDSKQESETAVDETRDVEPGGGDLTEKQTDDSSAEQDQSKINSNL